MIDHLDWMCRDKEYKIYLPSIKIIQMNEFLHYLYIQNRIRRLEPYAGLRVDFGFVK